MNASQTQLHEKQKVGKYQLGRFLGDGTFGAVFETTQPGPNRPCAIKVGVREFAQKKGLNWELVRQSLLAEPEIMARLDEHPNIIRVYDADEYADYPYVVMELMEGGLDKFVGKLDTAQAVDVFTQVSSAVKHLHDSNYAHQDIKPSNILMKRNGEGGLTAKLADLGTAKYMRETGSQVGYKGVVWTPGYIDPHVASGKSPASPASDIYSLGVTFYHVLTGKMPDLSNFQSPHELKANLPQELSALILDMMNPTTHKENDHAATQH